MQDQIFSANLRLALMQPISQLSVAQPIQTQPPLGEILWKLLEFGWGHFVDPVSLKAFQVGDEASKSADPARRAAGSVVALLALWQGFRKLDKKLSN
jgi:hypothetical protein